ncbi:hypothetical protein [Serratia surfactantfaciens]|uniref:hypothetical protein n=1 Tax=Serratia surfactantfaciens TaxID=2741499 RepID=UPI001B3C9D1F|nr:hypothetical protein [Serratia surfactantfaciens]
MKTVLQHIERNKESYAKLPLFEFLRDERRTPQERLAFLPHIAFFIMAFSDLNKFVLRDETPSIDSYQRKVNAHTYEDDHHWPWYLEDLHKLGYNRSATLAAHLEGLWSDGTRENRLLTYRLCALISSLSGLERIVVIEAIEATGNVLFGLTTPLANRIQQATGVELRYCGEFHLALESGHAQHQGQDDLAETTLTDAVRQRCIAHVDRVFAWFGDFTHEMLANIKASERLANPG